MLDGANNQAISQPINGLTANVRDSIYAIFRKCFFECPQFDVRGMSGYMAGRPTVPFMAGRSIVPRIAGRPTVPVMAGRPTVPI